MDDYNDNLFDDELLDLVERFERMIKEGSYMFFDADEFEEIIEYYLTIDEGNKAQHAIMFALRQHPQNQDILMLYVHYLYSINQLRKALSVLDEIEGLDPGNQDVLIMKGNIYSSKNKPEQAIIEFKKALNNPGNCSEVHFFIAKEYRKMEQFDTAIEHYKQSILNNSDEDWALHDLWYCYNSTSQHSEASEFFSQLTNILPYSQTAWFYLGSAYNALNLYEKAIEAYDFAIAIADTYTDAYLAKAEVYSEMELYYEAIETYQKILLFEVPDAEINAKIGANYQKLGNQAKAVEFFKKAVELGESNYYYWYLLGDAYMQVEQYSLAEIHLNKARAINDMDLEVKYKLALLYQNTSNYVKAENIYKKLIEFNFLTPPDVYLSYSELLLKQGRKKKAIKIIKHGLLFHGNEPSLTYRLAILMYQDGKRTEGLQLFSAALGSNYEMHLEIFSYAPELLSHLEILQLIEDLNPHRIKEQKRTEKPKKTRKRT